MIRPYSVVELSDYTFLFRILFLYGEGPHSVVSQGQDLLDVHSHVPIEVAPVIRPVLVTLDLRVSRQNIYRVFGKNDNLSYYFFQIDFCNCDIPPGDTVIYYIRYIIITTKLVTYSSLLLKVGEHDNGS